MIKNNSPNPLLQRATVLRLGTAFSALALAGLHSPVWADTSVGATNPIFVNVGGAVCTAVGTPAAGTNLWACQVPNATGGFASVSGIASNGAGNGPDPTAVAAFVATNLSVNAILIGSTSASATGNSAIAIAGQAEGDRSMAIGLASRAAAVDSTAIGSGASAFGNNSIALGRSAIAGVSGTPGTASGIAIGEIAQATGDNAIAIGRNTRAEGSGTVSIGRQAGLNSSNARSSTFVGESAGTGSSGVGSTAFGFGSGQTVTGTANTALGVASGQNVSGDANVAIGWRAGQNIGVAATPVNNASAIGFESKATVSGAVALGSNTLASTVAGVAGYVPAGASAAQATAIGATQSTLAAVSVGDVAGGRLRQINAVAAGTVDSDAVNVSQLKAVSSAAAASAVRYYSVNDNGMTGSNSNNDGATGVNSLAAGVAAKADGAGSVAIGEQARATPAGSVALGSGSLSAVASPTPSATVGAFTYTGFAGMSPLSVLSIGSTGAERQITNVGAGRVSPTSTDAINGSQLYSVAKGINDRIDGLPAGGGGAGPAGPQGPQGPQGPAGTNGINGATGPAGANGPNATTGAAGPAGANGLNGTNGATGPAGPAGPAGANGTDADTQGAVMYTRNADKSVNFNQVRLNPDGNNPAVITNLADGKSSSDAATVGQLGRETNKWITGNPVNYAAPKAAGQNALSAGSEAVARGNSTTALGYAATASGNNSVALGANSNDAGRSNVVSVGAIEAERQISNVAPGTQSTDAVNLNQLNAGIERTAMQLRDALNGLSRDANAGVAAAIAMANMPQAFTPGKSMVAAGVGTYGGQSSISIGVSKLSDSGRWVIKFGGSADTRGTLGVGAGAGFQW